MQDGNAKQQIVERIKGATNILVTVNSNPTVDELSAALGFTLMLNKMDKHATAVFSGKLPEELNFLEPGKTFENTVDSLRDFIIALDKEKADRLRYKVEDDVVRIFITPYKTTITDKDLIFEQGDFNVELIVALGVEKREDLDRAIVAHGRILHDATVVTINNQDEKNSIGSIDWHDNNSSSLCEMLMSLSEALQPGLLDEQISTALLTGIVAATERFSNRQTTPKVMTMAAQLMAAGANQQLIATKLEEKPEEKPAPPPPVNDTKNKENRDGSTDLEEGTSSRLNKDEPVNDFQALPEQLPQLPPIQEEQPSQQEQQNTPNPDGEIQIEHENQRELIRDSFDNQSPASSVTGTQGSGDGSEQYDVEQELSDRLNARFTALGQANAEQQLQQDLAQETEQQQQQEADANEIPLPQPQLPAPDAITPPVEQPQPPVQENLPEQNQAEAQKNQEQKPAPSIIHDAKPSWMGQRIEPPTLGSPFTATTEQALEDARRAREQDRSYTLLSHDKDGEEVPTQEPVEPAQPEAPAPAPSAPTLPEFPMQFEETPIPPPPMPAMEVQPTQGQEQPPQNQLQPEASQAQVPTIAELEAQALAATQAQPAQLVPPVPPQQQSADQDIDRARQAVSEALSGTEFDPANNPLQSVGAQAFPPIPRDEPMQVAPAPVPPVPPVPSVPPMPDFSTLPPLPGEAPQQQAESPFMDPNAIAPEQAPIAQAPPDAPSAPQQQENNPGQFKIPGQ